MAARRKAVVKPGDPPGATRIVHEDSRDMSERTRGAKKANELNPSALHQLRAADEGYREGTIAAMAECAVLARDMNLGNDETRMGRRIAGEILAELRRRFADFPDRIEHHLKLRGLA